MNINHLNYFKVLYEEKNITHAAENLYISRQALSKAILSLEEELGVKLTRGTHNGVEFTTAGDYFYKRTCILLKEYETTLNELKNMNEKGDYIIRLGVDYMTTYIYDEEALLPFTKTHPSVHFERIIRTPDELEKGYIENQYDIVLSHMDVPYTTEIKNISHIPFGVLLLSKDPLAKKKYLTDSDLENRKVYATGGNLLFVKECNQFFKSIGSSVTVRATETNELFTNLKFIEQKEILFLTTGYYRHSIEGSKLYKLLPFYYTGLKKLPNHDVYMYYEKNKLPQSLIHDLIYYLKTLPTKIKEI